ncbi:hypothetical protein [Streptomyces sp. NPDC093795]|uniref:hypothetical protein n=1 Tax=Streptomyces sp. NPDC093795 TaxID=3366051 RepID=UPI003805250F
MSVKPSFFERAGRRPFVWLVCAGLAGGGLTGCLSPSFLKSCEGSEALVEEVASLRIFDAAPAGATALRGFEEVESECVADSGDAWVAADRVYTYPGTQAQVLRHYRTVAERDGWELVPEDPSLAATTGRDVGLCFTRGGHGDMKVLDVFFPTAEYFEYGGLTPPGPEFDSGAGYVVTVSSEVDGDVQGC